MPLAASPARGAPVKPLSLTEARFYLCTTLFVAGNVALPALCHLVPGGGPTLLPIYFFTLITAWRFSRNTERAATARPWSSTCSQWPGRWAATRCASASLRTRPN